MLSRTSLLCFSAFAYASQFSRHVQMLSLLDQLSAPFVCAIKFVEVLYAGVNGSPFNVIN